MRWTSSLPARQPTALALVFGSLLLTACGGGGAQAAPTAPPKPTAAPPAATATRPALPSPSPQPQASPKPAAAPAAKPSPADVQEYEVVEGDTMGRIAQRFYGDSSLWRPIYEANRDVIGDDPDRIRIGTKLKIPPKPQ